MDQDGVPRPSGQAFNNDGDGEPMSGFLDSKVSELGLARCEVLRGHDGFFLVGLEVPVLLAEEQTVIRDPIEPPMYPCDPAHVAVTGPKGSGRRRRLARAAMWVADSCPPGVEARLEA